MICNFLIAFIIIGLCYYLKKYFDITTYWMSKNVRFVSPVPIFGNYFRFIFPNKPLADLITEYYNAFPGESCFGIFQFSHPILIVRDLDVIKQVTVEKFSSFMNHKTMFTPDVDPLWAKNLFSSTGSYWEKMRRELSPFFSDARLQEMSILIQESIRLKLEETKLLFTSSVQEEMLEFEMIDFFTSYVRTITASVVFGLDLEDFKKIEKEYTHNSMNLANFSGLNRFKVLLYFVPKMLLKLFKIKVVNENSVKYFQSLVAKKLEERKNQTTSNRQDLINMLIEIKRRSNQSDKIELDLDEFTSKAVSFLFDGVNALSFFLAFIVYELCANPNIQTRLQKEIDKVLEKDGFNIDSLLNIKYLDCVAKETLRKWPQGIWVDRYANEDVTLETRNRQIIHIDKGTVVFIPIFPIHRDPKYFESPDIFDPERFNERDHSAYIPFSMGRRGCIAQRYTMRVAKLLIAQLLATFDIVPSKGTVIPLELSENCLDLNSKHGFWFGMKRRI